MFDNEPRLTCWDCLRPKAHCHCETVAPFLAASNLIILQHPAEKKQFYSTSRLLNKWVENSKIQHGIQFNVNDILKLFPETALHLLYPSEKGMHAKETRFTNAASVIIIDGTWTQAKRIYRENSWLRSLPHISLQNVVISHYRIRKQPRKECLSTLEAFAYMFMESQTTTTAQAEPYRKLLDGFDKMVDTHLESIPADKLGYFKSPL